MVIKFLNKKGQEFEIDCGEDEILLQAGLRNGVLLPYECSTGTCGSCKALAKPGTVNEPEWDAVLPLEREFVDHLIKAKSALQGVDNMTITPTKDLNDTSVCIFSFGDEDGHNNRITYQVYGEIQPSDVNIPFNSDSFKNILNANKDLEEGTISINYGGLMELCFKSENRESEYFLIRKEQSAF